VSFRDNWLPNIVVTVARDLLFLLVVPWVWRRCLSLYRATRDVVFLLVAPWVWRHCVSSFRAVCATCASLYKRLRGRGVTVALTGRCVGVTTLTGSLSLAGSPTELSPEPPPSATRSAQARHHHHHIRRKRWRRREAARVAGKFAQWADLIAGHEIGQTKMCGTSALE
jgi:hypothetical protein